MGNKLAIQSGHNYDTKGEQKDTIWNRKERDGGQQG